MSFIIIDGEKRLRVEGVGVEKNIDWFQIDSI